MSRFDVQHRDAFESLAACEGRADLVLTSPPYPDARSDAQYGGAVFDTTLDGYHRLGLAVFDALRPGGVCVLNIDGPVRVWRPELGESERSIIALEVGVDWAKAIGFRYIDHEAYARDGFPTSAGPRWRSGWEPVHVFSRPGGEPYFDPWAYTKPARYAGQKPGKMRGRERGIMRVQEQRQPQADDRRLMSCERWVVDQTTTDREHAAPFSREWADAQVLCRSPADGLVCDPFVGSGTVALACHRHGRRFAGGDLGTRERDGRRWVDIVNEQLAQGTLFEATP